MSLDLEEMLALMAAPIYAKMRPESRLATEDNNDRMRIAVDEAVKLWHAVVNRTKVY